jgi:hypothetical protein
VHAARGLRRVFSGGLRGAVVGGQGGDVVVEFLSAAPTSRRHPRSPATQTKRNFAGLRLLYVQESHAREPKPPLSGIERRKLDLKLPPGAIPNFGADHEIKSQPRFVHAVLT